MDCQVPSSGLPACSGEAAKLPGAARHGSGAEARTGEARTTRRRRDSESWTGPAQEQGPMATQRGRAHGGGPVAAGWRRRAEPREGGLAPAGAGLSSPAKGLSTGSTGYDGPGGPEERDGSI